MRPHVIIDGNNLLYAMHEHAPIPHIGRVAMAKLIERWAADAGCAVTLVFDGAMPKGGLGQQILSDRINVRFSAPETADDVIVGMIHRSTAPKEIEVVSSDGAILYEARLRRCATSDSPSFVRTVFARRPETTTDVETREPEKPNRVTPQEAAELLDLLGEMDNDEPFDGGDAMRW